MQLASLIMLAGLFFGSSPALFAQPVLLKNAIVHTVSGGTLSSGEVLLNHGKIEAVSSQIAAPADAKILDLSGQHLYPGMIALDSALGLNEIEGVRATQDTTEVGEFHPDVEAWIAVNPDSELIPVTRVNGITHAEPAPQGGVVAGLSGVVALDGWTVEQMTIKRPAALHLYWPAMDLDITPPRGGRGRGAPAPGETKPLEEQARDRQGRLKAVDDFFLEARAYAKARAAGKAELNPPWEAMLPVVRGEIPVMVHAHEVRQIKAAVKWAQTNDYKIIIVGGQDAWKAAALLAARQVPVIYESVFDLPGRDSEAYDINFKSPELLRKAGVKVAFSMGAGGMSPAMGRNLPYLAAQAVAFGFRRMRRSEESRFTPRKSSAWPTASAPRARQGGEPVRLRRRNLRPARQREAPVDRREGDRPFHTPHASL